MVTITSTQTSIVQLRFNRIHRYFVGCRLVAGSCVKLRNSFQMLRLSGRTFEPVVGQLPAGIHRYVPSNSRWMDTIFHYSYEMMASHFSTTTITSLRKKLPYSFTQCLAT